MSRYARVRPATSWTGGLLPSDLANLDDRQFHAITKRGGSWATHDTGLGTNPIIIGGTQGLEITGPSRFDKLTGVTLATGVQVGYVSRSVTREQNLYRASSIGFGPVDETDRTPPGERAPILVQNVVGPTVEGVTVGACAILTLRIPVGASVNRIDVTCRSIRNDSDRDLAQFRPTIKLSRTDHTGAGASSNQVVDPSNTIDAYTTEHVLSIVPSGSQVFDGTTAWRLLILGEHGEGAETKFAVYSVRTTITQTLHDEWR